MGCSNSVTCKKLWPFTGETISYNGPSTTIVFTLQRSSSEKSIPNKTVHAFFKSHLEWFTKCDKLNGEHDYHLSGPIVTLGPLTEGYLSNQPTNTFSMANLVLALGDSIRFLRKILSWIDIR